MYVLGLVRRTPDAACRDETGDTNDDSSGEGEAPEVVRPAEYFNAAEEGRRRTQKTLELIEFKRIYFVFVYVLFDTTSSS